MLETFRYKGEEIKIQAWESRQKAKLEAEMRRVEVCEYSFNCHDDSFSKFLFNRLAYLKIAREKFVKA